jgi:hypothetical protein
MRAKCSSVRCQVGKPRIHVTHGIGERGSSLAWVAIFLTVVVIPLLALVIDGSRLFYVRGRLQTATDAACEDAAWSGADYRVFRDTGQTRFVPEMAPVIGRAQRIFSSTLGDRSSVNFTASASIVPDFVRVLVRCNASASVPLSVMLGAPVNIRTQAVSAVRFTR